MPKNGTIHPWALEITLPIRGVTDAATEYASRVVNGLEPAGPHVLGACRRHLAELAMQGTDDFPYVWRPETLSRFQSFCMLLRQYKGEWKNQPLRLMLWQSFICGSLLCWVHRDTGLRRFRTGYVEIPRKNGKTALAAALCLWMLMMDGESGAEVYTLGTKRDQARLVYDDALRFMPSSARAKHLIERTTGTTHPASLSVMRPLAADSKKLDGLNPHFWVGDELHEWPNRNLWDVVEDGAGARRQPLGLAITTAGSNKRGIAYTLRTAGVALAADAGARGFVLDSFFSYVAAPAECDHENWHEPRVWAAANPCLGTAKKLEYMQEQAALAAAMPSKLDTFKNKQLNIWTERANRWIRSDMWTDAAREYLAEDLIGQPCFGALDLARVTDLSAFALVFPPHGERTEWRSLVWHWCPRAAAERRTRGDKVPYLTWADAGLIKLTDGSATDFELIGRDVTELCRIYSPGAVAFDRMFASETVQRLQAEGVQMLAHGQGFAAMAGPCGELERLLTAGLWTHDGNPLLSWQAGNAVAVKDSAGNLKLDKDASAEKIDGLVALVMGVGAELNQRALDGEFYCWTPGG